mmetsp:Transcript_12048/g.48530  ORF Transcript_12048/g.48530 Transcript_12048/m.48530 type:complete len:221 (-) Transcript_12048:4096-4758(-)
MKSTRVEALSRLPAALTTMSLSLPRVSKEMSELLLAVSRMTSLVPSRDKMPSASQVMSSSELMVRSPVAVQTCAWRLPVALVESPDTASTGSRRNETKDTSSAEMLTSPSKLVVLSLVVVMALCEVMVASPSKRRSVSNSIRMLLAVMSACVLASTVMSSAESKKMSLPMFGVPSEWRVAAAPASMVVAVEESARTELAATDTSSSDSITMSSSALISIP